MSEFTSGNVPGFQPRVEGESQQITWSGAQGQNLAASLPIVLAADQLDPGNTPTTTIRAGNVLAIRAADGKACLYDASAEDGRQFALGILPQSINMLVDGAPADRFTTMLVHGLVKESLLLGLDLRARQQLAGRFLFDTLAPTPGPLAQPTGLLRTEGNLALTPAEHGVLLLVGGAATITLPTVENGLAFRIAQTVDANLVLQGSNNLLFGGAAGVDSIGFVTADEKAGSQVLVEGVLLDSVTPAWLVSNLGGTTATLP